MPSKNASAPQPASDAPTWQTLVIGRLVHFVMPDGSERAAVVTRIAGDGTGTCDLVVFTTAEEGGTFSATFNHGTARYDPTGGAQHGWHWPQASGCSAPTESVGSSATPATADTADGAPTQAQEGAVPA